MKVKHQYNQNFFVKGENEKFQSKTIQLGLIKNNIEFVRYLRFDICATLIKKNEIKIRIEKGKLFLIMLIVVKVSINFYLRNKIVPKEY